MTGTQIEHPFGHGRYECPQCLVTSIIIYAGVTAMVERKHPDPEVPEYVHGFPRAPGGGCHRQDHPAGSSSASAREQKPDLGPDVPDPGCPFDAVLSFRPLGGGFL